MRTQHLKRAFSLVELSIVLVVLSILVSIVMVGTTLLQNAHVNTIITEQYEYQNRIYKFYEIYNATPGDFPNAKLTFGCDANKNCNDGNGDRMVGTALANGGRETLQLWRHLSLVGIVSKSYTGVAANDNTVSQVGLNVPASRFGDNLGYMIFYNSTSLSSDVDNTLYNVLFLSSYDTQDENGLGTSAALSPRILYMVDHKIDDGKPDSGNLTAQRIGSMADTCYSNIDGKNIYLDGKIPECNMSYVLVGLPPVK